MTLLLDDPVQRSGPRQGRRVRDTRGRRARRRAVRLLGHWHQALLCYAVLLVTVPVLPVQPFHPHLDASWAFGLNRALAQGLVFGRDVVFTYGPYQSVFTKMFDPDVYRLTVLGGLILAVGLATALFVVLRDRPRWMWVLTAAPAFVDLPHKDALGLLLPLLTLEAVRILVSDSQVRPGLWRARMIIAVVTLPLGLLPLIKFSMAPSVAAAGLLGLVLLAKTRRWDLIPFFVATPVLGGLVLWVLAQQPLTALIDYIRTAIPLVRGYSEAMMWQSNVSLAAVFVAVAVLITVSSAVLSSDTGLTRVVMALMVALTLFMALKSGFVREDHAGFVATVLPATAALVAARCRRPRLQSLLVGTAALTMLAIVVAYGSPSVEQLRNSLRDSVTAVPGAAVGRVTDRPRLAREHEEALTRIREFQPLPELGHNTDVYSYNQAELLASRPRAWNPRPTFQSYAAYTPELLQRNARHLRDSGAPRRLLLRVEPIDERFPALEDGLSWPVLMEWYRPATWHDSSGVLALQRRTTPSPLARGTEPVDLRGRVGQPLEIPATTSGWLATIDLRPSSMGTLRALLWRSTRVKLDVETADGKTTAFTFIPEMGRSQFLLSPVVHTTADLNDVLVGRADEYAPEKVRSIRVRVPHGAKAWRSTYRVRLQRLQLPEQPAAASSSAPGR